MEVCEVDSNVSRRFSTFRAGNGRTFTPFTIHLTVLWKRGCNTLHLRCVAVRPHTAHPCSHGYLTFQRWEGV
jgi:hypothetical protein